MFWRFNYLSSDIDTLLDKENVTLQEILNEDDVLQECKAQNKKLVDFLTQPQNLEELVRYVTESPSENVAEKSRYKYPNIACELLTSDVTQITDALVSNQTLLEKVMTFVDADGLLNPLQTSFLGKVVGLLITRKSETVIDFLKSHDSYVDHILHHFGTSAIMDLLLRLITSMESLECRNNCIAYLMEKRLISKLIALIDPSKSSEESTNAAQTLCDLICLGREQIIQMGDQAAPDPLLAEIESRETISSLLDHMFSGSEPVESAVVSGLQVILMLLEFRKSATSESAVDAATPVDTVDRFSQAINNTVEAVIPRLADFHKLLLSPPKQHYLPMPWTLGTLERPLGNSRLQTARLMATLLATSSPAVITELAKLNTVNVLLDLFFEYSWNNFLHRQVELCITSILTNDSTENLLLAELVTSHKLVEKITKAFDDNERQQAMAGGCRQGYMGYLTRIANSLINNTTNGKNSQKIDDLILGLPIDVKENWEKCKSGALSEINKRNLCDLIPNMSLSSAGADDDEFSRIAFPQASITQKIGVGRTARLFGFNEDDFNEPDDEDTLGFGESRLSLSPSSGTNDATATALFEDRCAANMGQYDHGGDTNGEEDLWVDKEITFSSPSTTEPGASAAAAVSTSGQMIVSDPDSDDDVNEVKRHSSDSDDEELGSLPRIRQQPESNESAAALTTEAMDTSTVDDWAKFDETPMDVAAGIANQPFSWEAGASNTDVNVLPDTEASTGWANFDNAGTKDADTPASGDDSGWADFTTYSWSNAPQDSSSSGNESNPSNTSTRSSAYALPGSVDPAADNFADFNSSAYCGGCPTSSNQSSELCAPLADNGPS